MNYFNYFTEIEDTFVRRRGKHLWLSPMDWALIETWKDKGVPLHVALRSIERAFDSHDSKHQKRTVKTLLYCQEEVEAQFAEWQESRVGANDDLSDKDLADSGKDNLFSREAIRSHLVRSREALQGIYPRRISSNADDLAEALGRAIARLRELETEVTPETTPRAERIEDSLTAVERLLNTALMGTLPGDEVDAARQQSEIQLRPYRKQMDRETYLQTLDNMVLKRLRDSIALPRLSLFYL